MELDDELWEAFFTETDEHLDALERLLSATPWQAGEIGSAFRAMHSLKGLAQAVGLPNMRDLAHHSEDLLGMVRSGHATLDAALVHLLLSVTDRLRSMREWVQSYGTDAPQDATLAALLDRTVRDLAPAADVVAQPASPAVPLTDDAEMLGIYSELLEDLAPALASVLSDDPQVREVGHNHAESLANGAELLGFEQLAADLLALSVPGAKQFPELAEIAAQLALIEELTGVPAGSARLTAALAHAASEDAAQRLRDLRWALAQAPDLKNLLSAARATRLALETAGRGLSASILLRLEEALAAQPSADVEAGAQDAGNLLARYQAMLERIPLEHDLDPASAAAIDALWSPDNALQSRAEQLQLRPELLAILTAAQLARLEDRLAAGVHGYTLLLDLDGGETAGDVIAWLSSGPEVITSCTVFNVSSTSPSRSLFEFLILSESPPDALQAELMALDPEQLCVHGIQVVTPAGSAAPVNAPAAIATAQAASPVIRVRVETIERLMDEVSELRVALGALGEAMRGGELVCALKDMRRQTQRRVEPGRATRDMPDIRTLEHGHAALLDLQERMEELHRQVWNSCMELRVIPADNLFARFPRLVRDLSQTLGKPADLEIRGREVRMDKSTADLLIDPLMHMLRNALDHGVEPAAKRLVTGKPPRAQLVLTASEHGDGITITLEDDGAGIDRDKVLARAIERGLTDAKAAPGLSDREIFDFLFRPGFSTAAAVTEISGRGVGLDVVSSVIERLDGRIKIDTKPGLGTRFTLSLPSSASLQNVLLVQVPQTVALAERDVVAAMILSEVVREQVGRRSVIYFGDVPVPLVSLGGLLGLRDGTLPDPQAAEASAVIVSAGQELLALAVDAIPVRRELFLKELHPLLAQLQAVSGGAVLGDGRPVLVLDVAGLFGLARTHALIPERAASG